MIISTYAPNSIRPRQNLNAIEAARRAGVRRLAYTSFAGAGPAATADHTVEVHWPTEQALMASGMDYTILRHALYADIMVGDLDETLKTGVLRRASGSAALRLHRPRRSRLVRSEGARPTPGTKTASTPRRWNRPSPAPRSPHR